MLGNYEIIVTKVLEHIWEWFYIISFNFNLIEFRSVRLVDWEVQRKRRSHARKLCGEDLKKFSCLETSGEGLKQSTTRDGVRHRMLPMT